MVELPRTNPEVAKKFAEGLFVIRRTDKLWSGVGSDLTIEQTLMRSLKSNGGLTRGSGMTEDMRNVWTQSAAEISSVNFAMQDLTDLHFIGSDQHKESVPSRINRDQEDLEKLMQIADL